MSTFVLMIGDRKKRTGGIAKHTVAVVSGAENAGIPDFSQSAFALKKAERARAFIAKSGLPRKKKR